MTAIELIGLLQVFCQPIPGRQLVRAAELEHAGLIEPIAAGDWQITDRGRAFVEHVCALDLPEQVTVWKIGAVDSGGPQRPIGVLTSHTYSGGCFADDEGAPPPPAPAAKRINGVVIPEDPAELRAAVLRYLDNGFGTGETAEAFGLSQTDVESYFKAG